MIELGRVRVGRTTVAKARGTALRADRPLRTFADGPAHSPRWCRGTPLGHSEHGDGAVRALRSARCPSARRTSACFERRRPQASIGQPELHAIGMSKADAVFKENPCRQRSLEPRCLCGRAHRLAPAPDRQLSSPCAAMADPCRPAAGVDWGRFWDLVAEAYVDSLHRRVVRPESPPCVQELAEAPAAPSSS